MLQLATVFLNILLPVFALVLVGYVAGPRLKLDTRTLSKFAYYLIMPAFVFNVFRDASIEADVALRMVGFMLSATAGMVAIAWLLARLQRLSPAMTGAYILAAAFGNVGNFGLPVIHFKYGETALVAASVYFLVGSASGFIFGVLAATWRKGGSLRAVSAVLTTPGIAAIAPAFLVNYYDLQTPIFIDRAAELLAAALIPVMLVTLGVQLADVGKLRIDRHTVISGMIRLAPGAALAFALAPLFGLSGVVRGAGILQASMPVAVLAALIALEHDLMPDFVTTSVLFSTIASALTLTIVLALL